MTSSVALYEALTSAPDERTRARVIAEAFERLEERYPHLPDLATQGHVRESELRLQKEIEEVRARLEIKIEAVRSDLEVKIEAVRSDLEIKIEEIRSSLEVKIEQLRTELKTDIERTKSDLLKWIVPLMFAQVVAIAALVKLL